MSAELFFNGMTLFICTNGARRLENDRCIQNATDNGDRVPHGTLSDQSLCVIYGHRSGSFKAWNISHLFTQRFLTDVIIYSD